MGVVRVRGNPPTSRVNNKLNTALILVVRREVVREET